MSILPFDHFFYHEDDNNKVHNPKIKITIKGDLYLFHNKKSDKLLTAIVSKYNVNKTPLFVVGIFWNNFLQDKQLINDLFFNRKIDTAFHLLKLNKIIENNEISKYEDNFIFILANRNEFDIIPVIKDNILKSVYIFMDTIVIPRDLENDIDKIIEKNKNNLKYNLRRNIYKFEKFVYDEEDYVPNFKYTTVVEI